mmetsp:Transcript_19282/g.54469  ORF Transcript_19282/g.54469 Transcript_19282/m.54469 type:complete len:354 (-) Transcript_19282:223-1284(-)|eukprot:CAMPEP_0179298908 /NCGR_PEP_ID=MMETSP0797-20121207/46237_1 /TAXON_ID=47934 /ORGANISM="Dinophysis acuminata, Strain DAEP01" /LENGTH=353 /DNA_ID=CAMNT_0021008313 /DNA_START=48 /DNA_END=1109 /DNA_ORIENTATION=-
MVACRVCEGSGRLLCDICPLCDGAPGWPAVQAWAEHVDVSRAPSGATRVIGRSEALSTRAGEVSLVTYNTLCPYAVRVQGQEHTMFNHCADDVIEWSHRKDRVQSVVRTTNADIVCLQEVGCLTAPRKSDCPGPLPEWLQDLAAEDGYGSVAYYLRPRRSTGDDAKDGNVTLFRRNKFDLLHSAAVKTKGQYRSVVTLLRMRDEPTEVLAVCNVHLEGHPQRHQERNAQLRDALSHVYKHLPGHGGSGHIIIAGDCNSDIRGLADALSAESRFGLVDAFPAAGGPLLGAITLAEPNATYAVDHILVGSSLEVVCRRRVLDEDELADAESGLPSASHPSDHLPLALVVRIRTEI